MTRFIKDNALSIDEKMNKSLLPHHRFIPLQTYFSKLIIHFF
jgi:hypothetical protein